MDSARFETTTKCILFFLLCFLFLSTTPGFAGQVVTATGMSFFETGRELIGREKALDEARRAAIEKAVGATVDSRVAVENAQTIKDRIFTRSAGYVKNLEITNEKKTDFGTYEVTIKAEIEVADVVDDLTRFEQALQWQRNPRVAIVIQEGTKADFLPAATKASNLLTERLKQAGFQVFRYKNTEETRMGLLIGLSIEHSSSKTEYKDMELTLNEVSLSASIYRPSDGQILATSGAVKSIAGENRLQVIDDAAKSCVVSIWKDLSKKLTLAWEQEMTGERDIVLVVLNIPSHEKAVELVEIFKSDVSGVKDTDLLLFDKDKAEFSVKYRGRPEQFVNEISMTYFRKKYFDHVVDSVSDNRITIRIQ